MTLHDFLSLSTTLSWKKFRRFGMCLGCPYARVVVWTPHDQKLKSVKSYEYIPLR